MSSGSLASLLFGGLCASAIYVVNSSRTTQLIFSRNPLKLALARRTKAIVSILLIIDSLQMALLINLLYFHLVQRGSPVWTWRSSIVLLLTAFRDALVHLTFMGYTNLLRRQDLAKPFAITLSIVQFSLPIIPFALGLYLSINSLLVSSFTNPPSGSFLGLVDAYLAGVVVANIAITLSTAARFFATKAENERNRADAELGLGIDSQVPDEENSRSAYALSSNFVANCIAVLSLIVFLGASHPLVLIGIYCSLSHVGSASLFSFLSTQHSTPSASASQHLHIMGPRIITSQLSINDCTAEGKGKGIEHIAGNSPLSVSPSAATPVIDIGFTFPSKEDSEYARAYRTFTKRQEAEVSRESTSTESGSGLRSSSLLPPYNLNYSGSPVVSLVAPDDFDISAALASNLSRSQTISVVSSGHATPTIPPRTRTYLTPTPSTSPPSAFKMSPQGRSKSVRNATTSEIPPRGISSLRSSPSLISSSSTLSSTARRRQHRRSVSDLMNMPIAKRGSQKRRSASQGNNHFRVPSLSSRKSSSGHGHSDHGHGSKHTKSHSVKTVKRNSMYDPELGEEYDFFGSQVPTPMASQFNLSEGPQRLSL